MLMMMLLLMSMLMIARAVQFLARDEEEQDRPMVKLGSLYVPLYFSLPLFLSFFLSISLSYSVLSILLLQSTTTATILVFPPSHHPTD